MEPAVWAHRRFNTSFPVHASRPKGCLSAGNTCRTAESSQRGIAGSTESTDWLVAGGRGSMSVERQRLCSERPTHLEVDAVALLTARLSAQTKEGIDS